MRQIKLAFPEFYPEEHKEMFLQKRARKMKTQHDQQEYDKLEKEGKLSELPKSNAFHPEYVNPHADKEKKEETPLQHLNQNNQVEMFKTLVLIQVDYKSQCVLNLQ